MVMDPKNQGFSFSDHTYSSISDKQFPDPNQYPFTQSDFRFNSPSSSDLNFMNVVSNPSDISTNDLGPYSSSGSSQVGSFEPSPVWSPETDASGSSSDSYSTNPVLHYISQMLMEENMDDNPQMCYDSLALKATEKSLYDVLGEKYPFSSSPLLYINPESPGSNHLGFGSDYSCITITTSTASDFVGPQWSSDREFEFNSNPYSLQSSISYDYQFQINSQSFVNPSNGLPDMGNELSSVNEIIQTMFRGSESKLQFQSGLEEAAEFLPNDSRVDTQIVADIVDSEIPAKQTGEISLVMVEEDTIERMSSTHHQSRGRKNHERGEIDLDQMRQSKQSAEYVEESDLSEVFDRVLLWPPIEDKEGSSDSQAKQDEQSNSCKGKKINKKKQRKNIKNETVDFRSLLLLCAQAVSANDFRTANEFLKQIREHSSPYGDGSQRLAHYLANGLEVRLGGSATGIQNFYTTIASKKTTAADLLKAYNTYVSACPYKIISAILGNKMILCTAEKATTIHIIDFGVLYGFQWPFLIQLLSMRKGGPPKLRITGIELPQRGFRLAQRIEHTGQRLAKYCERFNVPFEYNPIAANNWENIPVEDLKIKSNEFLAVNCFNRFKNMLDETFEETCPRDAVLNLIRKINPNIFVHYVVNGTYNTPFFVTRFREALFYFSSHFDMFDSTISRDNEERIFFERDFFGREAMNVVACEGNARVERPETYKQWHFRTLRAGFKPLPIYEGVIETCRKVLKRWYHKDFIIDEDSHWLLQGWKGRIMNASSCWVPA